MSRLQEAVESRLQEIREVVRSGATEMTGRTYRDAEGRIAGRFKGGMSTVYPELARAGVAPGEAAAAVERGHGKVFERLRSAVPHELEPFVPRERKRGPLTAPPHSSLSRRCPHCGEFHATSEHRFHGKGAFHQTHLFAFGDNMEVPESFKKFLIFKGYLPSTFRPDLLRAVYVAHRHDRALWKEYEKWKEGENLFAKQGGLFSNRRNPGRGKAFTFHGSFQSKILAARRERETPGSFIVERGGRYYVLKPKKIRSNPRRIRSRGILLGRAIMLGYDREIGEHRGPYKHEFESGQRVYYRPSTDEIIIR